MKLKRRPIAESTPTRSTPIRLDSRRRHGRTPLHGLQRVLGVNALSRPPTATWARRSTTRSDWWRRSRWASRPGFIITGFIFYLTAATYAEATAMYPEAGGSSSFARRAFNEFASFFAAWAQMLNYTITIAISAFFVPHYLGSVVGVDALRHSPGDIFFGIGVVVVLSLSTWWASRSRPA
jgi:APA family basic amino acid/polyamine antiporter